MAAKEACALVLYSLKLLLDLISVGAPCIRRAAICDTHHHIFQNTAAAATTVTHTHIIMSPFFYTHLCCSISIDPMLNTCICTSFDRAVCEMGQELERWPGGRTAVQAKFHPPSKTMARAPYNGRYPLPNLRMYAPSSND